MSTLFQLPEKNKQKMYCFIKIQYVLLCCTCRNGDSSIGWHKGVVTCDDSTGVTGCTTQQLQGTVLCNVLIYLLFFSEGRSHTVSPTLHNNKIRNEGLRETLGNAKYIWYIYCVFMGMLTQTQQIHCSKCLQSFFCPSYNSLFILKVYIQQSFHYN